MTLPDEIRQQVIDVIHQQANRALDYLEATEIADAVLPIIAGWYEEQEERNVKIEVGERIRLVERAGKAEAERDDLRDEREDSLSRWHQVAESEAEVKRLTEERDAALERERQLIAHAEKDGDDIEALEAERDELLAAAAVFKAQRDALLPLVRWLKEELEQAAIRAHPRLIYADRYALEDLPDNLRAVLDAALTETPNE